jgi:hypothetical protein
MMGVTAISKLMEVKPWGAVIDSERRNPVPNSFVRLFNYKTREQVDMQVSDEKGRFGFVAEPGMYNVLVTSLGYKFPSKKQKKKLKGGLEDNFIQVEIEKGRGVSQDLYIDPTAEMLLTRVRGKKYQSPFGTRGDKRKMPKSPIKR